MKMASIVHPLPRGRGSVGGHGAAMRKHAGRRKPAGRGTA
jgi:hypothetical protein